MTTQADVLFRNSELSLAAYANLSKDLKTAAQIESLQHAGMSEIEATEFAKRYPDVVAVADYPGSGFQATVFREAGTGKLTVAMRGTLGAVDLLGADFGEITPYGAAYSQIVDMYNWWVRVSSPAGQPVQQYGFVSSTTRPENAMVKLSSTPAEHGGPSTDKYLVLLE